MKLNEVLLNARNTLQSVKLPAGRGGLGEAHLDIYITRPQPIRVRAIYGYIWIWVIYGSIGRFGAWNVFVWTFEDFKKMRLTFEIVIF